MGTPEQLWRRAQVYADERSIAIVNANPLGFGQDGAVWETDRETAVKAFERERNYLNERDAYQRLAEEKINRIGPFDVPTLVAFDHELMIVEMGIVSPPYLLDFGKAYVDRASPYTPEQIAESIDESRQLFDAGDWPAIEAAVLDLKLIGIIYLDIKPANIRPDDAKMDLY